MILKRLLTLVTNKIYNLPVIVLMPHSRCNCRCVMCDIWKANQEKKEISAEELERHIKTFVALGVKEVVFSGGEALMHSNLWKLCTLLKASRIRITLLSTGLLLEKHANDIIAHFNETIVSIDGSPAVHDKIRNISGGFAKLSNGVKALKKIKSNFRITGRCVLQRYNYFDFENIVDAAKEIKLDQISFLAADVSSTAFNRPEYWSGDRVSEVALSKEEVIDLEKILEQSFINLRQEYNSKFIAENFQKIRSLVTYYKAVNGIGEFPGTVCNAPWVSAVIESDGNVLPCFFHKSYGNIYEKDFLEIINSEHAISFRQNLNVAKDAICKKCVCSLNIGLAKMN